MPNACSNSMSAGCPRRNELTITRWITNTFLQSSFCGLFYLRSINFFQTDCVQFDEFRPKQREEGGDSCPSPSISLLWMNRIKKGLIFSISFLRTFFHRVMISLFHVLHTSKPMKNKLFHI